MEDEHEFPDSFLCPISLSLLSDPVILGSSGKTFERASIEEWLRNHNTNPFTNQLLHSVEDRALIPNINLRQSIEHYIQSVAGRILTSHELIVNEKLNEGSQKTVFSAKYKGKIVVVLKVREDNLAEKECKILVRLGCHPHLVRFIGRTTLDNDSKVGTGKSNAFVTEWAPLGDLSRHFVELADRDIILSLNHMLLIAEQVADGMTAVHAAGIIHRDLAARNVMVFALDANFLNKTLVKVGDYGLADFAGDKSYVSTITTSSSTSISPFRWMSPEALRSRRWSKQSDVWAFGVLLWEILTQGDYPYSYLDDSEVARRVDQERLRLSKPSSCPEDVWQLVERCWAIIPKDRPSFVELKTSLQQLRFQYSTIPPPIPPLSVQPVVTVPNTDFREEGNSFFKAKDYARAAESYTKGIENNDSNAALLFSNRAACYVQLNRNDLALADCRASLNLDLYNVKVYFRMAKLLLPNDIDAACSICFTIILLSHVKPSVEIIELYKTIQQNHYWLPVDITLIHGDGGNILSPQGCGEVLVLKPITEGYYFYNPGPANNISFTLIGLGKDVCIKSYFGHAIYITGAMSRVTLINLRLAGNGNMASACVSEKAVLNMIKCRVEDYTDSGLLVSGGISNISDCTFKRLPNLQAVEVRKGGELVADNVLIEDCNKGFSIYGGAKSAHIRNCLLQRIEREGIMATGTFLNTATHQQVELIPSRDTIAKQAEEWGILRGIQLQLILVDTKISHCKWFGLSADQGADVIVHGCRFESNGCHSIFIKGGTNASISGCQIIFSGQEILNYALGKQLNSGVELGINYGGVVDLFCNAFCGPKAVAIVDLIKRFKSYPAANASGIWSRPVASRENLFVTAVDALLSIESLKRMVSGSSIQIQQESLTTLNDTAKALKVRRYNSAMHRIGRVYPRSHWDLTDYQYDAIGNTFGYDIAKESTYPEEDSEVVNIFFGASGDIRNVLVTLNGSLRGKSFNIILNDSNLSMLARNILLLTVAQNESVAVEDFLALWASHGLTEQQYDILQSTLTSLADDPWPLWLTVAYSLTEGEEGNGLAETCMRNAFRAWQQCNMSLFDMLVYRSDIQTDGGAQLLALSLENFKGRLSKKQMEEMSCYAKTGSLKSHGKLVAPNLSFLLTPQLRYTVYLTSSIFRAIQIDNVITYPTLYERLLSTLTSQLACFRDTVNSAKLRIKLVHGNVIEVLSNSPADIRFDFIDLSNIGDYVSFPAILQVSIPLLSRKEGSRIFLESIVEYIRFKLVTGSAATPESFIDEMLAGVPLSAYEEWLGLRFIRGFEINSGNGLRMQWSVTRLECIDSLTPGYLFHILQTSAKQHLSFTGFGAPVTLIHWISLVAVDILEELVNAMITYDRNKTGSCLFEWELKMHTLIECGRLPPMICFEYSAMPGYYLLGHEHEALILVYTSKPVAQGQILPHSSIKQSLSSFAWDYSLGVVHFLATVNVKEKCRSWYITLCCTSKDVQLKCIGISQQLGTLKEVPLGNLTPWRRMNGYPYQEFMDGRVRTFLQNLVTVGKVKKSTWESYVAIGKSYVGLDILSPVPFPSVEQMKIHPVVSDDRKSILLEMIPNSPSNVSNPFSLQLPDNITIGRAVIVKINRSIGLVSARFPRIYR